MSWRGFVRPSPTGSTAQGVRRRTDGRFWPNRWPRDNAHVTIWSLEALVDTLGASDLAQVGRMSAQAILELDERLAEKAAGYSSPPRSPDEYRAVLPADVSLGGPELQTSLAYAHSTAVVDPVDDIFFDRELRPLLAGMTAAVVDAGATLDEAQERLEQERRRLIAGVLSKEDGLLWIRKRLAEAVEFLAEWRAVFDAKVLLTVPARAGMGASIMDVGRRPLLVPELLDPESVFAALDGLPWEIAYEEARGGVMTFNFQLMLARVVGGSPVAANDVSWRYLRTLLTQVPADARAHRILELSPLPGIRGIGPCDALALHREVDDFAEWHLRLRAVGRRLLSISADEVQFEREAREILQEELAPAVRRLRRHKGLTAVRNALPTEGLAIMFGAMGLAGTAAAGIPVAEGAVVALPIAAASRLAIAALRGPRDQDSPVLARLVRIEKRRSIRE